MHLLVPPTQIRASLFPFFPRSLCEINWSILAERNLWEPIQWICWLMSPPHPLLSFVSGGIMKTCLPCLLALVDNKVLFLFLSQQTDNCFSSVTYLWALWVPSIVYKFLPSHRCKIPLILVPLIHSSPNGHTYPSQCMNNVGIIVSLYQGRNSAFKIQITHN